ncbi:CocE/NonD family hydrolase [Nocardia colli]|uniref:CocE/NonD family hydrolase n=1 Tax=Nocardia colli TaxID=2545717 RepID=A0A5N0EF41_9NOCA|nr:CocE/NonD family hydrolase [Nocardia colli]KAA8887159.1 CocE/NonD family hydrolase [Nocardia colli]
MLRGARNSAIVLAMLAAVAVPASAAPEHAAWSPRPATYGIVVEKDAEVRMSDGVVLRADIRRPAENGQAAPGRFPVIVTQTPYQKNLPPLAFAFDYLVERGYVQVVADIRGTGSSDGEWGLNSARDQLDGKELVDWAAAPERAWSDGRIGLTGASYGGLAALTTAAQQPAALRAIVPAVAMVDAYRDLFMNGGANSTVMESGLIGIITGGGSLPPVSPSALGDPVGKALDRMRNNIGFQVLPGQQGDGEFAFDGPWYRERSASDVADRITVPTLMTTSHYDLFQRGGPLLYQRLSANRVPVKMIIGDWLHGAAATAATGVKSPLHPEPLSGPNQPELALRWLDHYVRDVPDPALDDDVAPVTYIELGSGEYRTTAQWPPADVGYRKFSLASNAQVGSPGILTAEDGDGGPDSVPAQPLAGFCSASTAQATSGMSQMVGAECSRDQQVNDLSGLTYDLPAAQTPIHLAGAINAHLVIAAQAPDGIVAVRVEDVAPDGKVTQLSSGLQRLSLRELDQARSMVQDGMIVQPWHPFTRESQRPMPIDQPVEADVEVFPTGAVIEPGHRLRVAVQTADFPHVFGNPQPAALRIHHDPQHPSWIAVPIRAAGA